MRRPSCSLCGIPFLHVNFDLFDKTRLKWRHSVRGVYARHGLEPPTITGIGHLGFSDEPFIFQAPVDQNASFCRSYTGALIESDIFDTSGKFEGYLCHEKCWQLLMSWATTNDDEAASLASSLYNILHSTPRDSGVLLPRYGYRGAEIFQSEGSVGFARFEYYLKDPSTSFYNDDDWVSESPPSVTTLIAKSEKDQDPFTRLADELLLILLSHLPSEDIFSLRLASKHVAAMSNPQELPRSFWMSRFSRGQEMEFALAGIPIPGNSGNWRGIYVTAKRALRNPLDFPDFKNKLRIWNVLRPILPLLRQDIDLDLKPQEKIRPKMMSSLHFDVGPAVSSEILDTQDSLIRLYNCRRLATQRFAWAPSSLENQGVRLGVSFHKEDYFWRHISGIRMCDLRDHETELTYDVVAGRILPLSEIWVSAFNLQRLTSITVTANTEGILGLQFTYTDHDGVETSCIAGDMDSQRPEVGIAKLQVDAQRQIAGIDVGYNALNIVSVQLLYCDRPSLENNSIDPQANASSCSSSEALTTKTESHYVRLWSPSIPDDGKTVAMEPLSQNYAFNRHLNIDFGGPSGSYLASLQIITVYMDDFTREFLGFRFDYADGRLLQFGQNIVLTGAGTPRPAIEVAFLLDSPNGEAISKVLVQNSPRVYQTVESIQICTSWGRSKLFRFDSEMKYDLKYSEGNPTKEFKPAEGEIISGFAASTQLSSGFLTGFGIITMQRKDGPRIEPYKSVTQRPHATCQMTGSLILHRHPTVVTEASLNYVSRIRISCGDNLRSRSKDYISGLWIEYHDDTPPEILGQWHSEHCSWDLGRGAIISAVTLTLTTEDANNDQAMATLGKVIGIDIETDLSSYSLSTTERGFPAMKACFRVNVYENLDRINWAFNKEFDYVRVLYCPKIRADASEPMLFDSQYPWLVRDRIFWAELDSKGNEKALRSVDIYQDRLGPTGIAFRYDSDITRSLGIVSQDVLTMVLDEGELLNRVDIERGEISPIKALKFWTTNGKSICTRHVGGPDTLSYSLHPSCKLKPDSSGIMPEQSSSPDSKIKECVGLWAPTRRKGKRFMQLEPIYAERDIVQKSSKENMKNEK